MSRTSITCRDKEKSRIRLFQQFTAAVTFEDTHLLNGNLIQLDQSFRLRDALLIVGHIHRSLTLLQLADYPLPCSGIPVAFHTERRSSISIGFDGSSIIRFQHGAFIGSSGHGVHCALPISRFQNRIGTIGSIRPNGIDQLRFAKHHWCSSVCDVGMGLVLRGMASSRSHVVGIGRLYRASDCLQSLVEVLPIWSVGMAMAFTDLFEPTTFPEKITQRNVLKRFLKHNYAFCRHMYAP